MPGGTRELSNNTDMPRLYDLEQADVLPALDKNGFPVAIPADLLSGAASGDMIASTWAQLFATPGTRVGQRGIVYGPDAGTHPDAEAGTVDNVAIYRWTGSFWRWVAPFRPSTIERDKVNLYQDPDMEDPNKYSYTGAPGLTRTENGSGLPSKSRYRIGANNTMNAVEFNTPYWSVVGGEWYNIIASLRKSTARLETKLFVDWYSDHSATVVVRSDEILPLYRTLFTDETADRILHAPANAVRARFRAIKPSTSTLSGFSLRNLQVYLAVNSNRIAPDAVTGSKKAPQDAVNIYPDSDMGDLEMWTKLSTNVEKIELYREGNTDNRASKYYVAHTHTKEAVEYATRAFPVTRDHYYRFAGRIGRLVNTPSFTTSGKLYVDFFTDYNGLVLYDTFLLSEAPLAAGSWGYWAEKEVQIPPTVTRARFRFVKDASIENTSIQTSDFEVKELVDSNLIRDEGILPSSLALNDTTNLYPDSDMIDEKFYTVVGAPEIIMTDNTLPRRTRMTVRHTPTEAKVEVKTKQFPVAPDRVYSAGGTMFQGMTSNLQWAAMDLYLDLYSDYDALIPLESILVGGKPATSAGSVRKIIRMPSYAVRAAFRAVKQASANQSQMALSGLDIREIPGQEVAARYADPQNLLDLKVNKTIIEGPEKFFQTIDEELKEMFAGGNATGKRSPLAAADLAECLIMPPTEEQTNFAFMTTPRMAWRSEVFRAIPVDIRTTMHSTPISLPVFRNTLANNSGSLVWRCVAGEPIHAILKGSMEVLHRVGDIGKEAAVKRLILCLRGWDMPEMEYGQNNGRRYLAQDANYLEDPKPIRHRALFNDQYAPLDATAIAAINAAPNLYIGSDPGYISSDYPDQEALIMFTPPTSTTPVGPEVVTTKWMDCAAIDKANQFIGMTFDGVGNRCRVQAKNAAGEISYVNEASGDISAKRLFKLPVDAVQFRVYYTGIMSTNANNNVKVAALPASMTAMYDPLLGLYSRFRFDVHREVVFYPNAYYMLNFIEQAWNGADARAESREDGYRYLSGGFSFLFDAGRIKKDLADKIFSGI